MVKVAWLAAAKRDPPPIQRPARLPTACPGLSSRAERGALAWTPKSCHGARPKSPTPSPFGHPDVRVLGGRRAAAAAVAPPAGQKLTAPDSECDADGCEISFYDVM